MQRDVPSPHPLMAKDDIKHGLSNLSRIITNGKSAEKRDIKP